MRKIVLKFLLIFIVGNNLSFHKALAEPNGNQSTAGATTTETLIYDGKDENGNILSSTIFTRFKKLSTIMVNNEKFFTGDGLIKIRFPQPPKKIDPSGKLVDFFTNSPGILVCTCKGCPIHDFDLSDLKDAFDQDLVNNITSEATKSNSRNSIPVGK